ncbi:hypothetical protein FZ983_13100 [Azospirillum sp. B21]|uniref:hypothetical protein n=1 Tax=Azospirillum sp. B21 TaxID=2607496 RepID=UPI0011F0354F|nr:hypothetical protein [Azospirillum sp. B21]KAA0580503.1 hypothetical protein FZ983_13100 [Azospirillum sp. B21]
MAVPAAMEAGRTDLLRRISFDRSRRCNEPAPGLLMMDERAGTAGRDIHQTEGRRRAMKGILLWLVGIPIPIIILLYLFNVF